MLKTHLSSNFSTSSITPSKEVLDIIVESAHGDIRSAIMALQFACIVELPGQKKKSQLENTIVLEAVTRREQSLALFHLLGKVMYNKRMLFDHQSFYELGETKWKAIYLPISPTGKDDPPNPSATAKDLQKERAIDASLKAPTKLPPHLRHHERRMSRVDVDVRLIIFLFHFSLNADQGCLSRRHSTLILPSNLLCSPSIFTKITHSFATK